MKGAAAVGVNDTVYIFGGRRQSDANGATDYFSNELNLIRGDQWEQVASTGASPDAVQGASIVHYQSRIYVFGGFSDTGCFNHMFSMDVSGSGTHEWETIPQQGSTPSPRHGHSAVVVGKEMFVFGGTNGFETLDDLHIFDFGEYS